MSFVTKVVDRLVELRRCEPVRTTVYPILLLGLGVLVASGKLSSDTSDLITSVVGVVLGITAAETARAKVTPQAKAAETVIDVVAAVQKAGVSAEMQAILDQARATVTQAIGRHRRAG
ncbi:hypothetical protein [Rhodococcus jostii]|uniref:hypothetical protein n=1 Tax=Rhodococcus jostii TaxID=132919 RepID=UPI0036439CF2